MNLKNFTIQKCQNGVGEWETFDKDGCPIETFDTYKEAFNFLTQEDRSA